MMAADPGMTDPGRTLWMAHQVRVDSVSHSDVAAVAGVDDEPSDMALMTISITVRVGLHVIRFSFNSWFNVSRAIHNVVKLVKVWLGLHVDPVLSHGSAATLRLQIPYSYYIHLIFITSSTPSVQKKEVKTYSPHHSFLLANNNGGRIRQCRRCLHR